MKCIQAVKDTKNNLKGDIIRVTDNEAINKVDTGYWKYVSKTEWKTLTRVKVEKTEKKSGSKDSKPKKNNKSMKNKVTK